jgi:predicted sulfurtransferase
MNTTHPQKRRVVIDGDRRDRRAFDVAPRNGRREPCQACGEQETDLISVQLAGKAFKLCTGCKARLDSKMEERKLRAQRERVQGSEAREAMKNGKGDKRRLDEEIHDKRELKRR